MFESINLQKELQQERTKTEVLEEVYLLLDQEAQSEERIKERLKEESSRASFIQLDLEDCSSVFTLKQIRNVCINYRLRFLDTRYFKSVFPYEAIQKIKAFEKKYNTQLSQFKIIAPAIAFDLQNINKDPMLFAVLGKDRFLLIHQWGKDLSWTKRITAWPVKNFRNYFLTLWLVAFLFSFTMPSSVMMEIMPLRELTLRCWLTVHTFIFLMGVTLWLGLSYDKTFSNLNWDSKYYNY